MTRTYDLGDASVVVVVGSGAGGGTLSNELAQKGVDVVCLEAGPWIPTSDIVNDEALMFERLTWRDKRIGSGALAPPFPVWSGKGVGGTTIHWTAALIKMTPHEFTPLTTYGRLPDTNAIDWPITADELEPYYQRAAKKMGATGTNGWPLLPETNNFKVMKAGGGRVGYKHISMGTMAINSISRDGRPPCQQLGWCKSGCAIDAKWTTANSEIPKALESGHFEIRAECMVLRVEHNKAGRVTGVLYVDNKGVEHMQKARVVVMAANAIDTPRILLNSATSQFADGLANSSGQVGRNYMRHMFGSVMAIMPGEVNFHRGTQNAGIIEDERPFRPERGFAGGFEFEGVSFSPSGLARFMMPGKWGREVTGAVDKYRNFAGMLVVGEDPAQESNGITLHPTEKDQYGLPVPIVHYEEHPNTKAMRKYAQTRAAAIYGALNAEKVFFGPPPPATHNMGTCRMSARAAEGVTNQWGQSHDIANLFIADGSVLTSSGGGNPTYTIVAVAIRVADHLAEALRRGDV